MESFEPMERSPSTASVRGNGNAGAQPTQPTIYPYSLRALRSLPRRIFFPPPAPSEKVQMAHSMRTCKLTPVFDIRLVDMMGKHLKLEGLPTLNIQYQRENICRHWH